MSNHNLYQLRDEYWKLLRNEWRLLNVLEARLGISFNPKIKTWSASDVLGSQIDLDCKEAHRTREEVESRYRAVLDQEKARWTEGYWYRWHPFNKERQNFKEEISMIRSKLKHHENTSCIPDVEEKKYKRWIVYHFRKKGFDCDCDFCQYNMKAGSSLYKRFYRG